MKLHARMEYKLVGRQEIRGAFRATIKKALPRQGLYWILAGTISDESSIAGLSSKPFGLVESRSRA
jgi:hypothetical protein